jgi:hypothetical protein
MISVRSTTPIEQHLADISDRGWHVYQARQLETSRPDHWCVHLRQITPAPIAAIAYGQGRTFTDALLMAIDAMDNAPTEAKPAISIFTSTNKPPPIDLRYLLRVGPTLSRRP